MRAIHNTPIPDDSGEFPIPEGCSCDGLTLCEPCQEVITADLAEQERERGGLAESNAGSAEKSPFRVRVPTGVTTRCR